MKHLWENHIWLWCVPECNCSKAKEEKEQREKERTKDFGKKTSPSSDIGNKFLKKTFENFQQTSQNEKILGACQRYVRDFNSYLNSGIGIIFSGESGRGKTHLASAIFNSLKEDYNCIFRTMDSLLSEIKHSYNSGSIDEYKIIRSLSVCDLLILDDLGTETPSEFALRILFQIINNRYNNERPIIITMKFNSEQELRRRLMEKSEEIGIEKMVSSITSRLFEMCRQIRVNGEDWRLR